MADNARHGQNVRHNTARDETVAAEEDTRPTCFVAMPITTPPQYAEALKDPAHFHHVLEVLFMPALDRAGYRAIPPVASGAQQIHAGIIRNLEQADLVLCDLSGLNPNVFFELGIRTSLDRPLVLVKDKMTERVPFDLSGINTYTYDETIASWSVAIERETLATHISAVEIGHEAGNEMWQFFGLTKRATSAEIEGDPTQAKLDLILKEVTRRQSTSAVSSLSTSPPNSRDKFAFSRDLGAYLESHGMRTESCFITFEGNESDPNRVHLRFPTPVDSSVELEIVEIARPYNLSLSFE